MGHVTSCRFPFAINSVRSSTLHVPRHVETARQAMGPDVWRRWMSPRRELTLTLILWHATIKGMDLDRLVVDISKSWQHAAFRTDGLMPK